MNTPYSSLIELVEQVNDGGDVAPESLSVYQQSANSAERFLAHHAGAAIGLRQCHEHLRNALESIDYSDRKVLEQFVGLSSFVGRDDDATGPTVAFGRSAIRRGETTLGLEAATSIAAQDLGRGGAWSRERNNLRDLAALVAEAAANEPWDGGGEWANDRPHVGYLTSALGDDEPAARAAAAFAGYVDAKRFKLSAYATEGYVRRDQQQWAGFPATPAKTAPNGASATRHTPGSTTAAARSPRPIEARTRSPGFVRPCGHVGRSDRRHRLHRRQGAGGSTCRRPDRRADRRCRGGRPGGRPRRLVAGGPAGVVDRSPDGLLRRRCRRRLLPRLCHRRRRRPVLGRSGQAHADHSRRHRPQGTRRHDAQAVGVRLARSGRHLLHRRRRRRRGHRHRDAAGDHRPASSPADGGLPRHRRRRDGVAPQDLRVGGRRSSRRLRRPAS